MAQRFFRSFAIRLLLLSNAALLVLLAVLLLKRDAVPPMAANTAVAAASGFVAKSPIADVANRVSPAVVSVGAVRTTVVRQRWLDDFFFSYVPQVAQQRIPYLGSGSLIDGAGHIVTNYHVIEGASEVFVTFTDGRELPARVLDADRFQDIALLKVDAEDLPEPLEVGDSDATQIGETVLALGNPFGQMIGDPRPTVTMGVISAINRSFRPDSENLRVYMDMIQTDAAINPGNSGGPLVDAEGRMIGINTFIFSRSGGSQGIGFAIPINRVMQVVTEIQKHGKLRDVFLDFDARTLRSNRQAGAVITMVMRGGPAAAAGLQPYDIVTAVDGRPIRTREDLILILASKQVGDRIRIAYVRDGALSETTYRVVEDRRPRR